MELQGFDTLEATRILEGSGMDTEQAEAVVLVVKSGAENRAMQADITTIKSDIVVLKSDVGELKSDVIVLKSDVAKLKSDIVVLKSDVSELKVDVALLKSDVSQIRSDMVTHADLQRLEKKMLFGGLTIAGLLFAALRLLA